ncbi:hypothetical protein SEVIR_1G154551v4 [Setaria viridis]
MDCEYGTEIRLINSKDFAGHKGNVQNTLTRAHRHRALALEGGGRRGAVGPCPKAMELTSGGLAVSRRQRNGAPRAVAERRMEAASEHPTRRRRKKGEEQNGCATSRGSSNGKESTEDSPLAANRAGKVAAALGGGGGNGGGGVRVWGSAGAGLIKEERGEGTGGISHGMEPWWPVWPWQCGRRHRCYPTGGRAGAGEEEEEADAWARPIFKPSQFHH